MWTKHSVVSTLAAVAVMACACGIEDPTDNPIESLPSVEEMASAGQQQLAPEDELSTAGAARDLDALLDQALGVPSTQPIDSFAFVIKAGRLMLVLDRQPQQDWAEGDPELVSDGHPVVVRRSVKTDAVPATLLQMRDRQVTLFDDRGPKCLATVGRVSLVGRFEPHFGERFAWSGQEGARRMSKAAIAAEAWELSGPVLAAELEGTTDRCTGATWARASELGNPELARFGRAPAELTRTALGAFHRLAPYAAVAKDFRELVTHPEVAHWEHHEEASPWVQVLCHRSTRTTLVSVSATAGMGCGEFMGRLTALWKVTGGTGTSALQLVGVIEDHVVPTAAVDVDRDGRLELLYDHGLIHLSKAGTVQLEELMVPNWDCPC